MIAVALLGLAVFLIIGSVVIEARAIPRRRAAELARIRTETEAATRAIRGIALAAQREMARVLIESQIRRGPR